MTSIYPISKHFELLLNQARWCRQQLTCEALSLLYSMSFIERWRYFLSWVLRIWTIHSCISRSTAPRNPSRHPSEVSLWSPCACKSSLPLIWLTHWIKLFFPSLADKKLREPCSLWQGLNYLFFNLVSIFSLRWHFTKSAYLSLFVCTWVRICMCVCTHKILFWNQRTY